MILETAVVPTTADFEAYQGREYADNPHMMYKGPLPVGKSLVTRRIHRLKMGYREYDVLQAAGASMVCYKQQEHYDSAATSAVCNKSERFMLLGVTF